MATQNPPLLSSHPHHAPHGHRSARPTALALRLLGLPVIAVAAVLIFNGLRERFALPECDSDRAKQTLSEVLKQLK